MKWLIDLFRAPPVYRLLCTECAPGTDWHPTTGGKCHGCGLYRMLMPLRVVR